MKVQTVQREVKASLFNHEGARVIIIFIDGFAQNQIKFYPGGDTELPEYTDEEIEKFDAPIMWDNKIEEDVRDLMEQADTGDACISAEEASLLLALTINKVKYGEM